MNAAVLHALNESPRFEDFSEPIAEENEVIVHVRAAALKPVDKQMADGSHYSAFRELPVVCGTDGVGCLDDGTRVFFARPRLPYGSMAQQSTQPAFPSPADASQSRLQAGRNNNAQDIKNILSGPTELASCGDEAQDKADRELFVQKYQEMHRLGREADASVTLYMGAENWPFPIPLVKTNGAWHFDPETGLKEDLHAIMQSHYTDKSQWENLLLRGGAWDAYPITWEAYLGKNTHPLNPPPAP